MYKVRRRWCVREVELPPDVLLSRRRLLRWLAVSLGLVNENDSREGVVIVLDALLYFWVSRKDCPSFEDLKLYVSRHYLERGDKPPTDEAVRKHLRKLVSIGFAVRERGRFCPSTDPRRPDDLSTVIDSVFDRVCSLRELVKTGFSHLKRMYE